MNPPKMRPSNLALRLGLEIGALTGLGLAAWNQTDGAARWIAVSAAPLAGATLWGTFNVLDDPSRSGEAPVEVPGWVRLALELFVLGAGWVAYGIAGYPAIGASFAALTVLHYTVARARVQWLLNRQLTAQVRSET
jgi:hypothetical protein